MTVHENLEIGAFVRRASRVEIEQDLERIFVRFPRLRERSGQRAGSLSGGEQQRVALARAFVVEPAILLADEPTGSLDHATGKSIMDLMLSMNQARGTTLILVTHDEGISQLCQRR